MIERKSTTYAFILCRKQQSLGYLDDMLIRTKELTTAMLVSCSTVTGNSICSLYSMRHFIELRPVKDCFSAVHIVWNVHASYEER
jgi:hypothetical protein